MASGGTGRRNAGLNWLAGGAVAAVLVPALALGIGLPFWLALIVAAASCGGIALLLAPKAPFEGLEERGIARAKIELARDLLEEAEPSVDRLTATGKSIKARMVGDRVLHLGKVARNILDGIEADPLKIDRVSRFITYYLPRAAEMAESYQVLETRPTPDVTRIKATGEIIERLDAAFTKYADDLVDADLDTLDIELKLLKSALDDDLGRLNAPQTAAVLPSKRST